MPVRTKRIYDPPSHGDGYRVLIDSIWPRGITRERAAVDQWARELAPRLGRRRSTFALSDPALEHLGRAALAMEQAQVPKDARGIGAPRAGDRLQSRERGLAFGQRERC